MGRYNPHIPKILGQQWTPIRESPLVLTPDANLVEVGHGFVLDTSKTIQSARFYLNEYPPGDPLGQVMLSAIYRQGTADQSGPVRSVVIPVSLGTVANGTVSIFDANTIAQALANPSDSAYVEVDAGQTPDITLRFETESYMPLLMGKRILGVDFLYTATIFPFGNTDVISTIGSTSSTRIDVGTIRSTLNPSTFSSSQVNRNVVGEIDYHWNAPVTAIIEVLPWTPNRLRGFDNSSSATDRFIQLNVLNPPDNVDSFFLFDYAALEVFFCEEQRVAYGGKRFVSGRGTYILGQNLLTMRDLTDAANPVLPAGEYDLILSSANLTQGNTSPYPKMNQIQELYSIPTHVPVRVIRPYPTDPTAVGKVFSSEATHLLPQLSLHASGGAALTEVHVYGRQAVAQVYGNITATQEIYDIPAGGAASYPWVRYYARRFGDTTVPLKLSTTSPAISGSTVDITPAEFDDLEEIVDGWKEVTLRFDSAPSMGAGTVPQWQWTAAGELVGNRWEILGAIAPALSGAPGNLLNLAPGNNQLSIATYGMPVSGANVNLGWVPQYAPPVSSTVDDQTSDATIMFAQDPAIITGVGATNQEQTVVGIGLDCGVNPCCIPSEIAYNQITWGLPANTGVGEDTFTRTVAAGGWGNAEIGGPYTVSSPATQWSVNGSQGVLTFTTVGTLMAALLNVGAVNFDIQADITFNELPLTNIIRAGVGGRADTTLNNVYFAQIRVSPTGAVTINIDKNVGGVGSTVATVTLPGLSMGPGGTLTIRFMAYGSNLKAKAWVTSEPEPETWLIEATDTSLTTGTWAGILAMDETPISGHGILVDNLRISPPLYYFGYNQLQRMDTVTTEWQTIMKATNPSITAFNDYEARVGVESSYRIRAVDVYDFPGPWSSTVTATVPEPGVTIGCEGGHLLIFTSNEQQDGSINLAYSSVWENQVEETFAFPESRFVELQAMYNRDFFTAFRPTERGGEQFGRTVLVQAAAISPETLADFTSLRDMAWADVSYICVRDEDGNRWFATVLVPSGRVVRNRTIYTAQVEIIEVTDTPSEVDP
jgi:hypothetical protein